MANTSSDSGGEFGIIEHYFAPLAKNTSGAFDLKDDAGLISPPEGHDLVLTTDMIIAGVHYLESAAPRDIAYKALAVNISDLCAKGATPSVYLLSIALPGIPDPLWLEGLREGFAEAQADFGCALLGGDTVSTQGPAVFSITAAGFVPSGRMVHRMGAKPGDHVYVTGTIGDAALGLILLRDDRQAETTKLSVEQTSFLHSRYWRPRPRIEAIDAILSHANAAMDISDGLAGDFSKLCSASRVGGKIDTASMPLSDAARQLVKAEPKYLSDVINGGDDYELLVTVPQNAQDQFESDCRNSGISVKSIGRILKLDEGISVLGADGKALELEKLSYAHF